VGGARCALGVDVHRGEVRCRRCCCGRRGCCHVVVEEKKKGSREVEVSIDHRKKRKIVDCFFLCCSRLFLRLSVSVCLSLSLTGCLLPPNKLSSQAEREREREKARKESGDKLTGAVVAAHRLMMILRSVVLLRSIVLLLLLLLVILLLLVHLLLRVHLLLLRVLLLLVVLRLLAVASSAGGHERRRRRVERERGGRRVELRRRRVLVVVLVGVAAALRRRVLPGIGHGSAAGVPPLEAARKKAARNTESGETIRERTKKKRK